MESIIKRLRDELGASPVDVDEAAGMLEFLFSQFETFVDRAGHKRYQWRGPDWSVRAHGPTIEDALRAAMREAREVEPLPDRPRPHDPCK